MGTWVAAGAVVDVGVGVCVAVGSGVGIAVGDAVAAGAAVSVGVGVCVATCVGSDVGVAVAVGTGMRVGVRVAVGSAVRVGTVVGVASFTWVAVAVGSGTVVGVPVGASVGVGESEQAVTANSRATVKNRRANHIRHVRISVPLISSSGNGTERAALYYCLRRSASCDVPVLVFNRNKFFSSGGDEKLGKGENGQMRKSANYSPRSPAERDWYVGKWVCPLCLL